MHRILAINSWRRPATFVFAALVAFLSLAHPLHAQQTVVANYTGNSLLVVDLATGVRTTLSDASTGTGTALNRPVGIGRESDGSILVGQDLSNSVVYRIDPTNGNRTVLSSNSVGTGPALGYVYGIAVDGSGNIYASCLTPASIVKIDPTNGNRTVIASSTVGSGDAWSSPWGIAAEPDGNLIVAMNGLGALYRLNPTTGVRTVISSSTVGTGANLVNPTGVARLNDGTLMVVNRNATDYVVRVDASTGNRTVVSSSTVGTGTTIGTRFTISFDTNGVLYTADFSANAVLKIDPTTGNRTVISNATTGSGPAFGSPIGILPNAVASITNPTPPSNPPVISSATTASGAYGSAFSYIIAGSNTPTSFSATGLPTGLSLDSSTGAIGGTPTQNGSFTVTLGATNADGTGSVALTLTIAKKGLTVSGVTASDKTYDRTTAATLSTGSASLVGVVGGDTVTLDASGASATFDTKNVGTVKTVTIAGLALGGGSASNYTLTQPAATAAIVAKTLTVSGVTASDKTYDGNTAATLSTAGASLSGVVSGDTVTLDPSSASGAFATKAVGSGKTVTVSSLALTGADAANYTLTQPATSAAISAKTLTVSGASAADKTYDGSVTATPSLVSASLVGVVSGDSVSLNASGAAAQFATKTVGTGKTVGLSGLALAGTDAGNYTLTQPAATAAITARTLTVSGIAASDRTYDASTTATLNASSASLVGAVDGDHVSLVTNSASGAFATKAAGSNKTVTVAGLTLSGADAANYTLTQPTTTATISARTLTVSGVTANDKTYDGNRNASLALGGASLSGVVSGDTVSLNGGGVSALFDTKSVGTGKTVTIASLALRGADAANYSLTQPTATAAIAAKTITVSGATAAAKMYDGSLTATPSFSGASLNGVVSGDVVTLDASGATAQFATKAVGTGKTVSFPGLALSGADAANYSLTPPTATANITAKGLTVSGITAANRTYDASTAAALNTGSASLVGAVGGDNVSLVTSGAAGSFASKAVGTGKTVAVSGLTLAGADASNYTLTQPTATADISAKAVTVSGVTASDKAYDGNQAASFSLGGASLSGVIGGDTVTLNGSSATATFDTKAVGTGKTVAIAALALAGADAANYSLTQPTATAAITAKALTVAGTTVASKTYDGSAAATPSFGGASLVGVVSGDAVSLSSTGATSQFDTKAVGTGKTVTISGLTLSGADAANYTLTQPTTTADIAAKGLTVSGVTASDRGYDGSSQAVVSFASAALVGVIGGDNVSLVSTAGAGTFASKAVGSAKAVTISGLALGGPDAGNYSLTQPTATAGITAKALTVTGATAATKPYDASTTATVDFSGAALVGVASGDTVALVSSGATGTFASATAGLGKTVTVTGLSLTGADSANYTLTAPTLTADIAKATATVALANLTQVYSGGARAVSASTTPTGLTVAIAYGSSSTPPVAVGSYAVSATIADGNYQGSATGTLVVGKADQTLSFLAPSSVAVGTATTLAASASSSLPVSFSLVSGNATVSGTTLTLHDSSPVVVRATQAGDESYNAISLDRSVTASGKMTQTIAFEAIPAKRSNDAAFTLNATATSDLPVSFTIVSGPALVSGRTLTLTGTTGDVVVRASQAGNSTYAAAPDVSQTFRVSSGDTHEIYFGATDHNDTLAIDLSPDRASATLLCYVSASREAFVVSLRLLPDGTFDASVAPLSVDNQSVSVDGRTVAAAVVPRTFRGRLEGGVFTGSIVELGLAFSATVQPANGPTAPIAGLYESSALNSAGGVTTSIVGTQGQVLVVAATAGMSTGGVGLVAGNGSFNVAAPAATIQGSVDQPTSTVSGTIVVPNQAPVGFSGVAATTLRTDRLVNLSSRARVNPSAGGTLIAGFVVGGNAQKRVLLRAIGPALTDFNVTGALANPRLRLFDGTGSLIAENDDWSGSDLSTASSQVGAFALRAGGRDAALLVTLDPGPYTMHVIDSGGTGVAMAEIYDASTNPSGEYHRLLNISTRGNVESGEGVLIGGFVVTGNSPKKVLVRGVGPALAGFGVTGALANPRLSIYQNGTVIAQNDDWAAPVSVAANQIVAQAADIAAAAKATGAFSYAAGSRDSAVIVMLAPGAYTAQVSSADGATGVAMVEVYEIPE